MMEFRKGGERRKIIEFAWGEEKRETVSEIVYLGYKRQENNEEHKNVKEIAAKVRYEARHYWA